MIETILLLSLPFGVIGLYLLFDDPTDHRSLWAKFNSMMKSSRLTRVSKNFTEPRTKQLKYTCLRLISSPYDKNLSYNIPILSYIGDPPMDGGLAYYPESAGFMLRVKCNGKIKRYQWSKS